MVDGLQFSGSGLRISKPGQDTSSADLDDYLLHESMPLEIVIGGAHIVASVFFREPTLAPGYFISVTRIPHSLGYAPVVELIGFWPGGPDIVASASESEVTLTINSATTTFGLEHVFDPPLVLLVYGAAAP